MTPTRPAGGGRRVAGGAAAQPMQLALFHRAPRAERRAPDVHAISIPARAFTGDFYVTHRASDRLWFALGDVAGKGLPAAVVMAMIQEELEHRIQSCAQALCDPTVTMTRLHAFLKPLIPMNRFATVVIGHLRDDGKLSIVNAGHCSPLIVRADGRVEQVGSTGPVVGVLSSSQWFTFETTLARGETLVLYSDGVLEARSPDGEEFGIERIEDGLSVGPVSAGQIAERILAAVNRHTGDVRDDDLTLVVVRR
ncbi:MAG TPA: PP2C family protein-serine/threonine phosphatase [Thermoanaerobaculia bacterium]